MPFVPPYFWLDGGIGVTKANFDAYGKCRIGIPRAVPVIGGATLAGIEWGLKETKPKWDLYAQFGYQITPDIPKICSPVKVKFNTKKKRVWWDKCCARTFLGCIGCPKFDFTNIVSFEWKTVCSKPIPGIKGKFRVGVLFNPNGNFYSRPAGTYVSGGDFFETMYLADYPDWEIPFYYHQDVSERHTMYFNYNWDRLYKFYPNNNNPDTGSSYFRPLIKPNPPQGIEADIAFDIPENVEVVIFRLNYSGNLNNSGDFFLESPDGTLYQGVDDNRPNGYPGSQPLVSSTHIRENREIFFTVVEPLSGKYNVVLAKSENIGEYTIEVLKQNSEPVIEYLDVMTSEATTQDAEKLSIQIQALLSDNDTPASDVNVRVYLDKTKDGFDGIIIGSTNLAAIGDEGVMDIVFDDHLVNSGQYYVYLEIDDNRNAPIQRYASGKVNVLTPYAIDPVANLKVKALNGGIAVTFAKSPMDTGFFDYDVIIRDEFFPDNSGLTYTISDNANEVDIYGLENGKPYLVSNPVDPDSLETGPITEEHRVVPGLSGQRPLTVYSIPPATATHGYPYQYQIKIFDGDAIENGVNNADLDQELSYSILNSPEGVEIDSGGFLSWNPDGVQPGEYQFSLKISKIFYDESDQANIGQDSSQDCLHEFKVLVNPAYNLSGVSERDLILFSQPPRKVTLHEIYNYELDVSGDLDTMNVTVTEGPEGMVYDPATNAVVWVADRVYSDFAEITIYDASFTKELARQRWFLDVVSENTILNTDLQITGYEQVLTDDGSIQTLIYWDAPQGAYEVQASTDLNGAWQSINGEVYEGGLGQVYGLDMQLDQGPEQLFIRVAPVDLQ